MNITTSFTKMGNSFNKKENRKNQNYKRNSKDVPTKNIVTMELKGGRKKMIVSMIKYIGNEGVNPTHSKW
jgi:hypothetical protein